MFDGGAAKCAKNLLTSAAGSDGQAISLHRSGNETDDSRKQRGSLALSIGVKEARFSIVDSLLSIGIWTIGEESGQAVPFIHAEIPSIVLLFCKMETVLTQGFLKGDEMGRF